MCSIYFNNTNSNTNNNSYRKTLSKNSIYFLYSWLKIVLRKEIYCQNLFCINISLKYSYKKQFSEKYLLK